MLNPKMLKIISNRQWQINSGNMKLFARAVSSQSSPGQIWCTRVTEHNDPLLRRPLSLYDVDKATVFNPLFKVVWPGTH